MSELELLVSEISTTISHTCFNSPLPAMKKQILKMQSTKVVCCIISAQLKI